MVLVLFRSFLTKIYLVQNRNFLILNSDLDKPTLDVIYQL